jgi:ribonuclease HII
MKTKIREKPTYDLEMNLRDHGFKYIVGVDEAGRGPLMGPVVAAAVHLPDGFPTDEINDSKKLSAKKRSELFAKIAAECDARIHLVQNDVIDQINIREATKLAMQFAISKVEKADYALIDGDFLPNFLEIPAKAVIGGDRISISIAAASIVAKVYRDHLVEKYHKQFPIYNWKKNKGYGTKEHRDAIKVYGITPYHRKSFGGVKEYINESC